MACAKRGVPAFVLSFVGREEYDETDSLPQHEYFSKLQIGTRIDDFAEKLGKAVGAEPAVHA